MVGCFVRWASFGREKIARRARLDFPATTTSDGKRASDSFARDGHGRGGVAERRGAHKEEQSRAEQSSAHSFLPQSPGSTKATGLLVELCLPARKDPSHFLDGAVGAPVGPPTRASSVEVQRTAATPRVTHVAPSHAAKPRLPRAATEGRGAWHPDHPAAAPRAEQGKVFPFSTAGRQKRERSSGSRTSAATKP